jgi:hypothetical protein
VLQQAASLYREDVERHLKFRYGFAEFWMISDLLLQFLQNLVSTCYMLCRLNWTLVGLGFAWLWHGLRPLYMSIL